MPLNDIFSKLKISIVGTKTSEIDTKLDKAVSDINIYRSQTGRNSYIDLMKSLISKSGDTGAVKNIFSQGGTTPASFGQGGRILRYKTYEAIVGSINHCKRALDVIVDNILSPDDITKISLEVKPKSYLEDKIATDSQTKRVKKLIQDLKLEERLDIIVKNTISSGDFFVEIGDSKTAAISRSFLTESQLSEAVMNGVQSGRKEILEFNYKVEKEDSTKPSGKVTIEKDIKVVVDFSSYMTEKNEIEIQGKPLSTFVNDIQNEEKEKKEKGNTDNNDERKSDPDLNVANIHLLLYDPKRVIKLQSDMFPMCFGYLVFPLVSLIPQLAIQDQAINQVCIQILRSVERKVPQITDHNINTNVLKDIVAAMLSQADSNAILNIRYVAPTRMEHFMVPSIKYYPYGESIFDSVQFNAKVLIAMETALAIQRLSRSTEKRKILVEIGLPRDARTAVEKLKEEFRKRKISLDSFGTVDTIPSNITTFEDVYIPQKDGKPFVDIGTFSDAGADTRNKVDELKFIRDSIVAATGVPPSFVGLEENLSNKAALSEENILFARTIVGHQKYLSAHIQNLVEKVMYVVAPDEAFTIMDNVLVAFAPPKSLQFEREARYMSDLANLVETLERIGIPKGYSKRKYLTNVDWKEVKNYEVEDKIDQNLTPPSDQSGMGGMGGGMPGIGGGLGF